MPRHQIPDGLCRVSSQVRWALVMGGALSLALAAGLTVNEAGPSAGLKAVPPDNTAFPRSGAEIVSNDSKPGKEASTIPQELTFAMAMAANSERKVEAGVRSAGSFAFSGTNVQRNNAVQCLATAALYEAGDNVRGERAVIQVILNRVRHPSYPNNVCDVVFEGAERKSGCQFTFTCDGSLRRGRSRNAMMRAEKIAGEALDGYVDQTVGTATHYHADYVVPYWSASLRKVATVDRHIFYTFPGRAGTRRALVARYDAGAESAFAGHTRMMADLPRAVTILESAVGSVGQGEPVKTIEKTANTVPPGFTSMAIDMAEPSGRWAVQALSACKGKAVCQIFGQAIGAPSMARPVFIYVRDGSGSDAPMWDCDRIPRADKTQCLPASGAPLDKLLRNRAD